MVACFCGAQLGTLDLLEQHATSQGHRMMCGCGKLFKDLKRAQDHQNAGPHPDPKTTSEHPALINHVTLAFSHKITVNGKVECSLCNRSLKNASAVKHMLDKHPTCPICHQSFTAEIKLRCHKKATGHCYCTQHNKDFDSLLSLRQHQRDAQHVTGFECMDCDRQFGSLRALNDHLDGKDHTAPDTETQDDPFDWTRAAAIAAPKEADLYCESCNRKFVNAKAFSQHKESVKHKPLSDFCCPMSDKCGQTFTSPSALILHLESGRCRSGMTRDKLNVVVHEHDTAHHITYNENTKLYVGGRTTSITPSLLSGVSVMDDILEDFDNLSLTSSDSDIVLTGTDTSSTSHSGLAIFTPAATSTHSGDFSNGGTILTPPYSSSALSEWSYINDNVLTPSATTVDWSSVSGVTVKGEAEYRCPSCPRIFRKLLQLKQHLASPTHAPKIYHCPIGLLSLSGKNTASFKTLSGFAQHVEAGACAGGKQTLKQVVGMFEQQIFAATGNNLKLLCD